MRESYASRGPCDRAVSEDRTNNRGLHHGIPDGRRNSRSTAVSTSHAMAIQQCCGGTVAAGQAPNCPQTASDSQAEATRANAVADYLVESIQALPAP